MKNEKKIQGKFYECRLIKLGGSWAVALNKEKLEKIGFKLGMPVDVSVEFDYKN